MECQGTYRHHLQGICTNDKDAIYWSFTTTLVKTDTSGKVAKQIEVGNHHGDLCHHDGRVYVAVNFGRFNDPDGNADSWVYVCILNPWVGGACYSQFDDSQQDDCLLGAARRD